MKFAVFSYLLGLTQTRGFKARTENFYQGGGGINDLLTPDPLNLIST